MPTNIFEVPVSYTAEVRGYRKVNHNYVTFLTSVPVRVVEVAAERAPVVMQAVTADGTQMSYRDMGDGRLVRNLVMPTPDGPREVTTDNVLEVMNAFAASLRARVGGEPLAWTFMPRQHDVHRVADPADWHEVCVDNPTEQIAAMRTVWAGACSVDGVIHVPSQGPCWTIASVLMRNGEPQPTPARIVKDRNGDEVLPAGVVRMPRLELLAERGHLSRSLPADWVFGPDQLLAAQIRLAQGLGYAGERIGLERYRGKPAPDAGVVWGERIAPPTLFHQVPVAETTAAMTSVMRHVGSDISRMKPEVIHLYADLRTIQATPLDSESAPVALELLARLRLEWIAHNGGKTPSSDALAPLLASLGRLEPGPDGAATPAPRGP